MQTRCMRSRNFVTSLIFLTKSKEGKAVEGEGFNRTFLAYHLSKLHTETYNTFRRKQSSQTTCFGVVLSLAVNELGVRNRKGFRFGLVLKITRSEMICYMYCNASCNM